MHHRILVATTGLLAAFAVAAPMPGHAAAANCGSAASQGATQGAGLGPSCEGQQPATTSTQGAVPNAGGAGTGTTPNGPGGNNGTASGGSSSTSGGAAGAGAGGKGK